MPVQGDAGSDQNDENEGNTSQGEADLPEMEASATDTEACEDKKDSVPETSTRNNETDVPDMEAREHETEACADEKDVTSDSACSPGTEV